MTHDLVEHQFKVDLRRLVRNGWTTGWLGVGDEDGTVRRTLGYSLDLTSQALVLAWSSGGVPYRVTITLEPTMPFFGGERWWALCPACGRRVAIVYRYASGFACRCCLSLAYTSQREDVFRRACRRVQKVRDRYGQDLSLTVPWRRKPPRMRWTTFARLVARDDSLSLAAFAAMRTEYP